MCIVQTDFLSSRNHLLALSKVGYDTFRLLKCASDANWIFFPFTVIYWPLVSYCWGCSVVDQVPQVVGFVSLGYPFGVRVHQ